MSNAPKFFEIPANIVSNDVITDQHFIHHLKVNRRINLLDIMQAAHVHPDLFNRTRLFQADAYITGCLFRVTVKDQEPFTVSVVLGKDGAANPAVKLESVDERGNLLMAPSGIREFVITSVRDGVPSTIHALYDFTVFLDNRKGSLWSRAEIKDRGCTSNGQKTEAIVELLGIVPKLQYSEVRNGGRDDYQIPWKGVRSDTDPDLMVPVPYHCLRRMFDALSYTQIVRPGTCLERDVLQAEQCIIDEIERRKKK